MRTDELAGVDEIGGQIAVLVASSVALLLAFLVARKSDEDVRRLLIGASLCIGPSCLWAGAQIVMFSSSRRVGLFPGDEVLFFGTLFGGFGLVVLSLGRWSVIRRRGAIATAFGAHVLAWAVGFALVVVSTVGI